MNTVQAIRPGGRLVTAQVGKLCGERRTLILPDKSEVYANDDCVLYALAVGCPVVTSDISVDDQLTLALKKEIKT